MLTTKPRLSIRQPSPTTIEYTVTTIPPPTVPLRLALGLVAIVRLLLGISLVSLIYSKLQSSPYAIPIEASPYNLRDLPLSIEELPLYLLSTFQQSSLGRTSESFALAIPTIFLVPISVLLSSLLLKPLHKTESLLVLRGLGIQTSSSPASYLSYLSSLTFSFQSPASYGTGGGSGPGGAIGVGWETRFIPMEEVQDLFVNEVFMGWGVRYMLGVVVKGEEEVVVVFPGLLPGRDVVEQVWKGGRRALWGKDESIGKTT